MPALAILVHRIGISCRVNTLIALYQETLMPDRVLIVGAGPTGLTAALELSRLGIAVRIIDKQAAPPTTSRAVGVQARTLEVLELRGLLDQRRRRAQHRPGDPRRSVRGQDTRRTVRPGRPAHRWRTRGDRSPHLLLRARLPGLVPHGQPALPPDGQQPAQPAQQEYGTGARRAASDLRPALADP